MTERTHDLAGVTMLIVYLATQPLSSMSLGTAVTAYIANQLGTATPDIDNASAEIWDKLPAGNLLGKIVRPLLGNHRMISHSLFGMALAGFGLPYLLNYIHGFLLVDMQVVWSAFMLGYASHLVMDSLTKEGVPWLFPIPIRFGFPPFKFLRFTTDKWGEKIIVFPALLGLNTYLIYSNYEKLVDFLKNYLVK